MSRTALLVSVDHIPPVSRCHTLLGAADSARRAVEQGQKSVACNFNFASAMPLMFASWDDRDIEDLVRLMRKLADVMIASGDPA